MIRLLRVSGLVLVAWLLVGCSSQYVLCVGKGSITSQGLYGGGITVDCPPPGLEFYSGKTPAEAPASAEAPTPATPGKLFAPANPK